MAERDLSFRLWAQELKSKVPNFILTRMEGGSQFPVANLLRHYFREYASRIVAHGPHSFPTSFNVIESFLMYSHDYFMFDLREEKEHLLRLRDYIDWYTSGSIPDEPEILLEVVKEGLIYSYHMVEPVEDFRVETKDAELVVSGVALVRHSTELSMIILCGEKPGDITDEVISRFDEARPVMGKEGLKVDPSYSVDDRFLKEIPGYSRIIGLVRFDLTSRKFFVRYLNHDFGKSYRVATDDPTIFTNNITETEREKSLKASFDILVSYEQLFGLLVSAMYLPVFFLDRTDRVAQTKFSTELQARRASTEVRKAIRQLGSKSIYFSRTVSCFQNTTSESAEDSRTIVPPALEFAESGFWKSLAPGEIGEDEDGNPIVGKTWVERTETWSSHSVESFLVRKYEKRIQGPNPGHVYIMRSGSHALDLYKVGKTRRAPEVRARELTGVTGVPTSFEVLATWEVGDVDYVENEAHHRLRTYKVNRRREFFRAPLSTIVAEIELIVKELLAKTDCTDRIST